jgi:hypothetical protein
MQWETGDASDGVGGIGGVSARSGYANGAGHSLELPGSGVSGALLDGGSDALITSSNIGVPGRWQFAIRN